MRTLTFVAVLMLVACNQKNLDKSPSEYLDSLTEARRLDSSVAVRMKELFMDTNGVYKSPVQVTSFKVKEGVVTNDIEITYKNFSGKIIDAVKFMWYAEDAFAEPVEFSMSEPGFGQGSDDNELNPGEERRTIWNGSDKVKRVKLAWPIQTVDHDGIKWSRRE